MTIRFRKSIQLFPGVRINLSKSGVSTTLGKRGASINVGKRGTRATVGIPGTGISYVSTAAGANPLLNLKGPMNGTPTKALHEKFCSECGQAINAKAEICPKCGCRQMTAARSLAPRKDKAIAGLLALFLGGIGVHKFYLGKSMQGIIYLLFCWTFIPAVIAFFEALRYFFMSEESFAAEQSS